MGDEFDENDRNRMQEKPRTLSRKIKQPLIVWPKLDHDCHTSCATA